MQLFSFFGVPYRTANGVNSNAGDVSPSSSNTLTNKTITSNTNVLGGVTMTLGSDGVGDIYYRDSGGHLARLAAGADTNVLTLASGLPAWSVGGGGGGGATIALDNLAAVSINSALLFQTGIDIGSAAKAARYLFLYGDGTFATTSVKLTSTPTGNRVWTFPDATDTVVGLGQANIFSSAIQTVQGLTTTSPGWYSQITGDSVPRVRVGVNATDVASIGFGSGSATRDAFIERVGAGNLRFGGIDVDTAPVAQILSVQNALTGGTSNVAGANWTFKGSQGKGTGAGGSIIFQVAPAGSTGTAVNALTNALAIASDLSSTFSGTVKAGPNGIQFPSQVTAGANFQIGNAAGTIMVFSGGSGGYLWENNALTAYNAGLDNSGNFSLLNSGVFAWMAGTSVLGGTKDTGLSRNAAGVVEINSGTAGTFRDLKVRQHFVDQTITAGGTTGNQTINKAAGTVNIAASGSSVTVTNSLVTTSSTIYCSVRTNDTTALIKNVVPGSGSFVITMNATVTAETSIGFLVVN